MQRISPCTNAKLTIATECGVGPVISRVLRVRTALSSMFIARTLSLSLKLNFNVMDYQLPW